MLNVSYSKQAEKFLEKAEKDVARRIYDKIEELRVNPFPHGVRRVEGYQEKLFRERVGDYRILHEVDHRQNLLGIVKIDKRSRVY
ncbi:type II toxin-antitoxin system RelE/ParE family toxin [Candidatus Woesearchaeota archaeon]|nr:type II toxin-antitoxin system RelE/ParE family toxin [Candidatus Woesearchaeota archaeon]